MKKLLIRYLIWERKLTARLLVRLTPGENRSQVGRRTARPVTRRYQRGSRKST